MMIRREDLTEEAKGLGLWESLLELAGVHRTKENSNDCDDLDIEITLARINIDL
jgi:hypothetical protein